MAQRDTPCSRIHTHDDVEPGHYTAWLAWAQELSRTHTQHRCPACHRFKVWLPLDSSENALLSELAARPAS